MKRRESFTLIELLVVMGIIGLLVALLFPAIGAARLAANRARAQAEVRALEAAMNKYLLDYGRFPGQTTAADKSYTSGNASQIAEYAALIDTLRGVTTSNNPRREVYLEVATGSVTTNGFVDPWDRPYRMVVDGNFDKSISLPSPLSGTVQGRSVVVWSAGPDGTNVANFIKSWD